MNSTRDISLRYPVFSDEDRKAYEDLEGEKLDYEAKSFDFLLKFLSHLKRRQLVDLYTKPFLTSDAFVIALVDPSIEPDHVKYVTKIPDLVSNASHGQTEVVIWCQKIIECAELLRTMKYSDSGSIKDFVLPTLISNICFHYNYKEDVIKLLAQVFRSKPMSGSACHMEAILDNTFVAQHQHRLISMIVTNSETSDEIGTILGKKFPSKHFNTCYQLLVYRLELDPRPFSRYVHYLQKCLEHAHYHELIVKSLTLWCDPQIAKCHVMSEVLRHTKLVLILLMYSNREFMSKNKQDLIEKLLSGLPNHFQSSDGRSIILAQFFCSVITKTIDQTTSFEAVNQSEVLSNRLCQDVVQFLTECEESVAYLDTWLAVDVKSYEQSQLELVGNAADLKPSQDEELLDEDDDSDLEPIESLEASATSKVKYLRDFLDNYPEFKTHQDMSAALRDLPSTIRKQLALEHPQVGKDLTQVLFSWENEFEDPKLDEKRKDSMISVLCAKPEGNIEYLCQLFHKSKPQSYKKTLILDVISKSCKSATLKDLNLICKTSFNLLLLNPGIINDQDVVVRVPMILFFSHLLCCMPKEMIVQEYVIDYFNSITNIENVDAATNQTICYAIKSVMNFLGDRKLESDVQYSIRGLRDKLLQNQSLL